MAINYNGRNYRKHLKQKYFYTSKYMGMYSRCLHRQMWFDVYGEIPKGFQIHHKDGDAFNNSIDNFELVEGREHSRAHSIKRFKDNPEKLLKIAEAGRELAKEWHGSEAGINWHRENAIKCDFGHREYGERECDSCQTKFIAKRAMQRFCSNACKSAYRRRNNPDMITRKCDKCESEYITRKYLPAYYCSKECKPAPNPNGRKGKKA